MTPLTVPQVWRKVPLPGVPPVRDGQRFCSPFRPDRHPGCYLRDGLRQFVDWGVEPPIATGPIGVIALALGLSPEASARSPADRDRIDAWLSGHALPISQHSPFMQTFLDPEPVLRKNLAYLDCRLSPLETDRIEKATVALARLRRLPVAGVRLAVQRGLVIFGHNPPPRHIRAFWGLYDPVAETLSVRRLDGLPWANPDGTPGPKCKTPQGWGQSPPGFWGVSCLRPHHEVVLLVEGAPDFLAAHCLIGSGSCDPGTTAVVAAASCHSRFSPTDLLHFMGRAVVAFPQKDANGQSSDAVERWKRQLAPAALSFCTVPEPKGDQVKDLNDVITRAEGL